MAMILKQLSICCYRRLQVYASVRITLDPPALCYRVPNTGLFSAQEKAGYILWFYFIQADGAILKHGPSGWIYAAGPP